MDSTEKLVQTLGHLRQDGQHVNTLLDDIDDDVSDLRDGLDVAKNLADKAQGLARTASSLDTISRFLSSAPIVGLVVRNLTVALDRLQDSANTIADYANTLDTRIEPVRDNLTSLESSVDGAKENVNATVANLMVYEGSAQSLNDAFPDIPPKPVTVVIEQTNALLDPAADRLDTLTDTLTHTKTQVQTPLSQLNDAIAPLDQALTIALDIEQKLGPLNQPLQALNTALKPFEVIFNAADFIINRTLGPIINPILERTGLQNLIDRFTTALDPLDHLRQPIADGVNGVTANFDTVDVDIEDFNTTLADVSAQLETIDLSDVFPVDAIATGDELGNVISGSELDNVFQGLGRKDILLGGEGNDTLSGGTANDILLGGPGNDQISGGKGNDRLSGGAGDDQLDGKGGKDKLYGGEGDDILLGGGGKDQLLGESGEDELMGGGGKDVLDGGDDHDVLDGGGGKDSLNGGEGDDRLTGGGGRDVFVLARQMGTDTITDFTPGKDQIRLGQGLSFNQLTFVQQSGDTLIQTGNQTIGILEDVTQSLSEADFT